MNIAYDYTREYNALLNFCEADGSLYNARIPPSGSFAILHAEKKGGVMAKRVGGDWGVVGLGLAGIVLGFGLVW